MRFNRRRTLISLGAFTVGVLASCRDLPKSESDKASVTAKPVSSSSDRLKLIVGLQDNALQETVIASGVLDGLPFDLQWAIIPGPAAQLSALYSKAIDVGLLGDTSLIIEQGRAKTEWTEANIPLQIVALWKNPDPSFRTYVTAVRTSANIKTLADLRGKKWTSNFGGLNYLTYVLSRSKAGLKATDIEPVMLVDGSAAAAAFTSGRADAYSGSLGAIKEDVDSGKSRVLVYGEDLGILGATAFAARNDVIADADKSKALAEFLTRLRTHWSWFAKNLDVVEKVYVEKRKQTPKRAKYFASVSSAAFVPIDDELVKRQQRIADILLESGDITKKIDVSVELSRKFNSVTTG
ncbi:MAG: PhnD/SsuA/transferrin family substrate-binding protein [Nostoc sp.]|uniref:PhnD/SsuA/transferrin family substrate-binding protein n=1 Tax=Nostoc sp. TaxID=1180 RepID=UPI002FEFA4FD